MFREIRRKDRILDNELAIRLLEEAEYGFLAMSGINGYGYGIPINLAFIHSNLFYNTMFSINIIQIYRLYFFLLAFRLIYFIASHTPDKETNVPPNMVPHITIFHKTG